MQSIQLSDRQNQLGFAGLSLQEGTGYKFSERFMHWFEADNADKKDIRGPDSFPVKRTEPENK